MIEARLQVNGVSRRNPDRRTIARLPPHPQRSQPLFRVRQTQLSRELLQQLPWLRLEAQIGLR
jgi:hypothetical protein